MESKKNVQKFKETLSHKIFLLYIPLRKGVVLTQENIPRIHKMNSADILRYI